MQTPASTHHYFRVCAAALVALACCAAVLIQGVAAGQECGSTNSCPDNSMCCSQYGYCGRDSAYCGQGCQNGPCDAQTPVQGTAPPQGQSAAADWSAILTEALFDQQFHNRNPFYTYAALTTAASNYPAFGTTGSSDAQKREIAAFCAHVTQEAGGLQYTDEIGGGVYCDASNSAYPCAPGKSYHGRGPLQISWNFNYGLAGADLNYPDLLGNPEQVSQDPVLAFKTAIWFWMTQPSSSSSCHQAMTNGAPAGFGQTIDIINGGVECGHGSDSRVTARVQYYQNFCQAIGVDPGSNLYC